MSQIICSQGGHLISGQMAKSIFFGMDSSPFVSSWHLTSLLRAVQSKKALLPIYFSEGGMVSSIWAAQFIKASTRIVWRVGGRRTSLRLVQCAKVNSWNFFNVGVEEVNSLKQSATVTRVLFFHEYGRRVGMVPRSSLKGGKNSLMVEKITRTTTTTQKPQPKAHRPSLHHHVVFPLC